MRRVLALSLLLVVVACGGQGNGELRHGEPVRATAQSAAVIGVGEGEVAAATAAETAAPAKRVKRARRRANLNGWLDLTSLRDDLRYVVGGEDVSGVVELKRGGYEVLALRGESEVGRIAVEVRTGAVTGVDASALSPKPELRGVTRGCRRSHSVEDPTVSWMAKHQAADGSWGAESVCDVAQCDPRAPDASPAATTGLALLGFLGAGETHQSGAYKEHVKGGLRYLKSIQTADGWFVAPSRDRNLLHAQATLAMIEAYGLTSSRLVKAPAQRALDALLGARGHAVAWARDEFGRADAETTVWAVFCLRSARLSGLDLPERAFEDANAALDAFGDPGTAPGLSLRETAGLTIARILAGSDPRKSADVQSGIVRLLENPPERASDPLYVYFGTLAAFQTGGTPWRDWNRSLKPAVTDTQRTEKDAHARGSWDPDGPAAAAMGRLTTTAVRTLVVEVYYRYGRVFGASR